MTQAKGYSCKRIFMGGLWGNDSYGKTSLNLPLQGDLTHKSGERLVQKS